MKRILNKIVRYNKLVAITAISLFLVSCANVDTNVANNDVQVTTEETENVEEIMSSISETTEQLESSDEINTSEETLKEEKNDSNDASELQVHFIDVGQGDATLITCDGHAMLIDAGDNNKGTTVQLYLKKQNIKKLDYLVLTHPDADHIGGADVIVTKFDIDNVFMSSFTKDNKTYNELIDALNYKSMKWSTPTVGDTYSLGSAKFTIIAPNNTYTDPNNSSVGLELRNGNNGFLFTGDAEETAEKDIMANKINIDVDVYQVGHHGSRTASSKAFLNAVNPKWAVVSCGMDNSYGHPHSETLNNLRAMGANLFRTDEQGTIIAISDGNEITWNCAPTDTWKAGESTQSSEEKVKKEETTQKVEKADTSQKEEKAVVEATTPISNTTTYICNTNTMKFHVPSCSSVGQMNESNKKEVTCTRDELINQGYVPCKRCNP